MTGFGAGKATIGDEELSVEVKSVNHKFCEVKGRLPRELAALEATVVKQVKERISRGAVEVTVRRQPSAGATSAPVVDLGLAKEYLRAYGELAQALGLRLEPRVELIAQQPGVMRVEERGPKLEDAQRALEQALEQALTALTAMREREGQALRVDLQGRLATVARLRAELELQAPQAVQAYKARLEERIAELLGAAEIDAQRLAQEVALFAERTDVAEEMARLSSHQAQLGALLDASEPAGRRMDFLVQEMNREVNTTGSKSQHPGISSRVVELKAELERIREQVQNVE
jgi:uncharacterized protein (TIGR00255 family)